MRLATYKGRKLIQGSNSTITTISLFRGNRSFTERDRHVLNLLQPHLAQVVQATQDFPQFQQPHQTFHDFLDVVGGIVLSREGRIHALSQKAEQLLKNYFHDFKHFSQSLPELLKQWVKHQQSLLSEHNTTLKPLVPLKVEEGEKILNIRLAADPTKDQYILLLSEQKPPSLTSQLLENLGLTPREGEILFWVIEGKTNAEISILLDIKIGTVKKHLENIYFKLEVTTRSGAVTTAFKKLGLLNLDWLIEL